ncbi:hypothetical protein [Lachnospira pectinoschiza]|uniref:Uncharacterized protein n=1 Tax=Lachnospira pectinoschiza TaxID=28052 RepID=A0A1G9TIQ8_9FIRM|nr:hypothetical protein [Lachnospira pectinoschiza]SDM47530.1 hypothetical protein SAMN05216544_0369 [Lachnospira pectinoschiza]
MQKFRKPVALAMVGVMCFSLCACKSNKSSDSGSDSDTTTSVEKTEAMTAIENALNLSNMDAEWTYSDTSDAWTLSIVTAVTNPEIEDEQGVSVCVPGAYVEGVDTDGDGKADATSGTVTGDLVINETASVTSTNGQVYTAKTAPVIINTGAAGYSEQSNQTAGSTYASEGYINVACGNRGKQSTLDDGTYTGDAPCCLVDQKNAVRFVKYNILLGNLPGSVDYFVSTGGSGGGAHATMLAATSDNEDFYDYEIEAGAVGVYKTDDGKYITSVTIDGKEVSLSDGMWGCMAYSAITSLAEADMTLAFEYYLDTTYSFNTDFQKETAKLLAKEYMDYINDQNLSVKESDLGYDLNDDGDTNDTVDLTIEYDENGHTDTNGYYGTYLDLYLAEFEQSLEDYLDRLDYTEDWTWFNSSGTALSDSEVAAMTSEDRALAFVEGRYTKGSTSTSSSSDMGSGAPSGDSSGAPSGDSSGAPSGDSSSLPSGGPSSNSSSSSAGGPPSMGSSSSSGAPSMGSSSSSGAPSGDSSSSSSSSSSGSSTDIVGTPDAGTTQSASSTVDSSNYSSYSEMLEEYKSDIAEIEALDEYGNNIVELYNPLNYIGAEGTNNPTWSRILMGASEGDISMFNSLNIQVAWLNAGTDAEIEWQWDGGHVPSEILGDSLPLYVDMMYGKYVSGAVSVTKAAGSGQTTNGTSTSATGTDLSSWVTYDESSGVSFSLAAAAAYRTAGASKAIPGFDVMDYGQEDYVFGSSSKDVRHWDKYVLKVFEDNEDTLSSLFNN